MGLLSSQFLLEPISHGDHIIRKKADLHFSDQRDPPFCRQILS